MKFIIMMKLKIIIKIEIDNHHEIYNHDANDNVQDWHPEGNLVTSVATFTPHSEDQFGTISCSADTAVFLSFSSSVFLSFCQQYFFQFVICNLYSC